MKSIKNPTEVKWMKHFGLLDSVAICESLMNVEVKIAAGETLYELDVAEMLKKSRADIAGDAYKGKKSHTREYRALGRKTKFII